MHVVLRTKGGNPIAQIWGEDDRKMTGVTNQKIQRTISVLAVLLATLCTAAVGKTIYVDDDGQAAQSLPDYVPLVGDLNGDCRVDDVDFALLEENWLQDNSLTEEWFKVD